jgi:uncharacterized repeat protein (TIGR03803 family)
LQNESKYERSVSVNTRLERAFEVFALYVMTAITLQAQVFTPLHSFDGADGWLPYAAIAQGIDGNLYGTTYYGGTSGHGTLFKISPRGALTTLYSFCPQGSSTGCLDGELPWAGLLLAADGNFYGTTTGGDRNCLYEGCGTIFKVAPSGALTTLHDFCTPSECPDGANPYAGLIQGIDGDFYGTTSAGGNSFYGGGTVFRFTPRGALSTLHAFCPQGGVCTDGANPKTPLLQAADGTFYGTTQLAGANGGGTVFKIAATGAVTTLYSFCSQSLCADGKYPNGLVQGMDGDFYGTTMNGGANCPNGELCGTIFKITPSGSLTTLHSFCALSGCADGANPNAGVIQGTDGNFYGTTVYGGPNMYLRECCAGTIFQMTPDGSVETIYNFCSRDDCTDGALPYAGLVQDTNGDFYGTTQVGGSTRHGTVYKISVGLAQFVKTVPHAGRVGQIIRILGTDLTGTISVSFNDIPATFTVEAPTEITATLPSGASTGTVQVTTPTATLSSAGPFTIVP